MKIVIERALSIKQPWLFLILQHYKDMEIRTSNTKFRGVFGLHASRQFDREGREYIIENREDIQLPLEYKVGQILGIANLWNVMQFKDKDQFHTFKGRHLNDSEWYIKRMKAYVLQDVHTLKKSIPYKGQLGLFKLDEPLEVIY